MQNRKVPTFSFAPAKAIASSQVSRWGSLHSQLKKHVVTAVHGPQMMQNVDRAKGARKGWEKVRVITSYDVRRRFRKSSAKWPHAPGNG